MFKLGKITLLSIVLTAPVISNASTYAISTTSIDNFSVSGGLVSGWTFSQNMAINGTTVLANGDSLNAPASCINCTYDDSFMPHGIGASFTYSDALISSTDLNGGTGAASSIAEIYSGNGISGSATSSNSMMGLLDIADTGTVTFNFDVNYYLEVLTSNSDSGYANMSFDLGLYAFGSNVNLLDSDAAASMFLGIGPTNGLADTGTSGSVAIDLAAGSYNLDIEMTQNVATTVSAVPVPAAVWLFGSGLIGLAGFARRKKA